MMVLLRRLLRIRIQHRLSFPAHAKYSTKEGVDYVPRRACLYIPGSDEKKLRKIPGIQADCVVMDCEDGVAINKKDEARHTIQRLLGELEFGRSEPVVRVNALGSGLTEADVKVCLTGDVLPRTVMLPKVERPAELDVFSEMLSKQVSDTLNLMIFTESAVGLLNLQSICERALALQRDGAPIRLQGIVFGSEDFRADIGASRTQDARELLFARQKIVVVAKAYGLQAIDLVHIDFKDTASLLEESLEGARMGFTGKQCIHPLQVAVVQEAFSPSAARLEWATALVEAFTQHQSSGKGAFTFRGSMIDMPLLLQAKNILNMAEQTNRTEKT